MRFSASPRDAEPRTLKVLEFTWSAFWASLKIRSPAINIKPLKIGNVEVPLPVIQAGMGVQIAKSALAAAVARAGGIGCISSVGLGTLEGSLNNYIEESNVNLTAEIRKARALAPGKPLAVNVMMALSNYDEIVKVCVKEKVDIIISGAGLPISLPALTEGSDIKIVPVVSSGRSLEVLLKTWTRRYRRLPDGVIVEGPLNGGHLAFTWEQLEHPETVALPILFKEIKNTLAPYEAEYGRKVPVLGAENIAACEDILAMLEIGFDGVQVGTRFICTEESGLDIESKKVYVNARAEDVVIIQSPLGLPVKVLKTPFSERILRGEKIPFGCPFLCLRACKAEKARFCLAEALVDTLFGNTEKGLYMTGSGIGRVNEIVPAEEFLEPLRKMVE